MKLFIIFLLIAAVAGSIFSAPSKQVDELAIVKAELAAARDSLQNEMADRWRNKQRFTEQRETDKEEFNQIAVQQERLYSLSAQAKEECYVLEKSIQDMQSVRQAGRESYTALIAAFEDELISRTQKLAEAFPADLETRRMALESMRRQLNARQNPREAVVSLGSYYFALIAQWSTCSFEKQTILPGQGGSEAVTMARFGNLFAYGISEKSDIYMIRQSGKNGRDFYAVEKIESPSMRGRLQTLFAGWFTRNTLEGAVLVDVLTNEQAGLLIAGKQISSLRAFYNSLKAGGAIMIPLLLLPFWALGLILIKLIQFGRKQKQYMMTMQIVTKHLDADDHSSLSAYLPSAPGALARMIGACLQHKSGSRSAAEKIAREQLLGELPQLNKYLNTVAVIAGAAPLLGLLGTVSGMINLFGAVTYYGTGDPKFLAGGISEALITAKTGLMIAIPALFIHDYLRNRRDRLVADLEKHALTILNRLWPNG